MDINRKKDTVLTDFIRFSWKATRGLINNPEDHVPYWSDRLTRSGKLTPEQVSQLSSFISERTHQAHDRFMETISETITEAVNKMADLTDQELTKIEDKMNRLSDRIDRLS